MYDILQYSPDQEAHLDRFVLNEAVNGTFLQSRLFLNYHPKDRFADASFALHKSGTLAAYFPGTKKNEEFISHQGSTYGGPVVAKAFYSASRTLEILKEADSYFQQNFQKVRLKLTPAIFAKESPDLIEYALEHLGYARHTELSAYTLLNDKDPLEHCEKDCRRIFRVSEKFNVEYRDFTNEDFLTFYKHLEISKAKHGVKPVHTLPELLDLQNRLPQNLRFRGIWVDGEYVAGMMLFLFPELHVVHAQYIAPNDSFKEFAPTTCLYINALREAAKEGFTKFSWGISTEDAGNILNENLFRFKESFGAKPSVNVTYTKQF